MFLFWIIRGVPLVAFGTEKAETIVINLISIIVQKKTLLNKAVPHATIKVEKVK